MTDPMQSPKPFAIADHAMLPLLIDWEVEDGSTASGRGHLAVVVSPDGHLLAWSTRRDGAVAVWSALANLDLHGRLPPIVELDAGMLVALHNHDFQINFRMTSLASQALVERRLRRISHVVQSNHRGLVKISDLRAYLDLALLSMTEAAHG